MQENINVDIETTSKSSPKDLDAEKALLGILLVKGELFPDVLEILSNEAFYLSKHRSIFKAMHKLYDIQEAIDSITVTSQLEKYNDLANIGGKEYLFQLVDTSPTTLNVKSYSKIISDKYIKRRLIDAGEAISAKAYSTSVAIGEILDSAESLLFEISQSHFTIGYSPLNKTLPHLIDKILALKDKKLEYRGVPSGIKTLDDKLSGLQKSDLIIIAARPSAGKTTFALDIARKAATKHNVSVGFFSLEMSESQLSEKMLSAQAMLPAWELRIGKLDTDSSLQSLTDAAGVLSKAPIYIDDSAGADTLHIKTTARRMKREQNINLLIVDYMQLVRPYNMDSNTSLVHQVTEVSRTLKQIARDLDIPVIALSQLSRDIEKRGGTPRLSDLRDSGSIEQDADVVMFLHKPKEDYSIDTEINKTSVPIKVIISKHRNGPTSSFDIQFNKKFNTFVDLAKESQEEIEGTLSATESEEF